LWKIYLSGKNFLLWLFPFPLRKKPPLWVTIGTNTSCAVNSFFSCTRVFTFYMYVRTYISLSSSTILAPKGQRLKRTLESKLEPPYSSGHHFFWQLVSCSRLGCCHCSIFVVVANCWRFLNHFYVICAIIWQSGNLRNGRK